VGEGGGYYMKKLNKERLKQRTNLIQSLGEKYDSLAEAHEKFREETAILWEKIVQPHLDTYNQSISDAVGFVSEVVGDMDNYVSKAGS